MVFRQLLLYILNFRRLLESVNAGSSPSRVKDKNGFSRDGGEVGARVCAHIPVKAPQ